MSFLSWDSRKSRFFFVFVCFVCSSFIWKPHGVGPQIWFWNILLWDIWVFCFKTSPAGQFYIEGDNYLPMFPSLTSRWEAKVHFEKPKMKILILPLLPPWRWTPSCVLRSFSVFCFQPHADTVGVTWDDVCSLRERFFLLLFAMWRKQRECWLHLMEFGTISQEVVLICRR